MKFVFKYSLKVWISTIILTPLLIYFGKKMLLNPANIANITLNDFCSFLGPQLFVSLYTSILAVLIFTFATYYICRMQFSSIKKKMLFSILILILTITSFVYYTKSEYYDLFTFNLIMYIITSIVFVWYYKLENSTFASYLQPIKTK